MTTTYLFPSTLQGLADVSVSPGDTHSGKPLIWDNALGQWVVSLLPWPSINTATTATFTPATFGNDLGIQVVLPSNSNNLAKGVGVTKNILSTGIQAFCTLGNTTGQNDRFLPVIQGRASGGTEGAFGIISYAHEGLTASGEGALNLRVRGGLPTSVPLQPIANNLKAFSFRNNAFEIASVTGGGDWAFKAPSPSTSTTTGAITVAGGVGIAGNLYVGAKVNLGNVPTSPTGLAAGDVWRDGDVLKVVL